MKKYKNLENNEIKTLPEWKDWARIYECSITFPLGNQKKINIMSKNYELIASCELISNGKNKVKCKK